LLCIFTKIVQIIGKLLTYSLKFDNLIKASTREGIIRRKKLGKREGRIIENKVDQNVYP
jgi:hypothetical protein